jgi:membrane associated rhomboid family serine protease
MIPLRDTQPSYSKPVVTILLIVINTMAFLFEVSLDPFSRNHLIAVFGIVPDRIGMNYSALLTSMFLHGGWMHLIGNMWFLWIFGDNIEDILGHWKYLIFYLACGLAAGLSHVLLNPASRVPTIGASGAIAGVMGAYLIKFPHARVLTLVPIFLFLTTFELPAYVILMYWFVIQFFSGLGSIAYSHLTSEGVAWFAHVGGFLAGIVLVNVMGAKQPYHRRRDLDW